MDLTNLPLELQYQIYLKAPAADILKLCQTNRYFSTLCSDADFWRYRAYQDFMVTSDIFDDTDLSAPLRYLQLMSTVGERCSPGSERFTDIDNCLYRSARDRDYQTLDYFLNREGKIRLYRALLGAIEANDTELVRRIIRLSENPKYYFLKFDLGFSFRRAVRHGNIDIVKYLSNVIHELLPDTYNRLINSSLYDAAKNADIRMLEFLYSLGANDINRIFLGAVAGGHTDIIDNTLRSGANDFDNALTEAVNNGDKDLIRRIIDLGVTNFKPALYAASSYKNIDFLKYLLREMDRRNIPLDRNYLDTMISNAVGHDNGDIVAYLIALGPTSLNRSIGESINSEKGYLQYLINEARRLNILDHRRLEDALALSLMLDKETNTTFLTRMGIDIYPYLEREIVNAIFNEETLAVVEKAYSRGLIDRDRINDLMGIARDNGNYDIIPHLENLIISNTD